MPQEGFALVVNTASNLAGLAWFAAWLFAIGYLRLSFGQGVLALLLWPYYLGRAFAGSLRRPQ